MNAIKERFTKGEELANAISHLVGAVLGLVGLILMIAYSLQNGTGWHLAGSIVYGSSLFVLYLSSTFNHWLPDGQAKEFFFTFDQIAIYILIAGTYTPLALIALHGTLGWVIFAIEWTFALVGILIKIFKPTKFNQGVSLFFIIAYIVMGSIVFFATRQVIDAVSLSGFVWVIAGGVFYIGGTVFYKMKSVKFIHLVWHLCVMAGSAAHFIGIYFYVLPLQVT
ncbi:MAG: hemolysin III family protein [Anaerolineae bacterium]|jgi:hemolysin III|nr:hemolysin III family protein [Anaerolineae bacterium]MBT7072231.1 hemolysin III family protein [Anaerolineae bacterium]MBT7323979.1 hemolysin III family protein [Anaerolineae bacterium]